MERLDKNFFCRDVLEVAPDLIGKIIVRRFDNGNEQQFIITETEAYRGEDDLACHASKGRTARTEIMYQEGSYIYVYLIYGMYWMLNFVTGEKNNPQATLIRGIENVSGPGKVANILKIDKSFYGEDLTVSDRIWVSKPLSPVAFTIDKLPRVGVDYAGEYWKNLPWRFKMKQTGLEQRGKKP
jgi:DNA-3-methyladenine glycosylase